MKAAMTGLDQHEAARRLQEHGPNQIQHAESQPAWRLFLEQFSSPLVLILIFACGLAVVMGERVEALAIGAILILNAVIGFFQEYRAETAIAALREVTAPRARVLRAGRQALILAQAVVPGDILVLEAGDIVAADAEILELSHFQVNEAVLTGESLPVSKVKGANAVDEAPLHERFGHVFMGTSVATGTALARVSATGMKTELGKIAHLISTAQSEKTPLQMELARIGRTLSYICLAVVVLVAVIGFFRGVALVELMLFSISLAVAAVPEGLPAIVTVALAQGVRRLAAQRALIRKLPSVETLGSVSVICTDKTGTLTTGNMKVREVWSEDQVELLKAAASCCDADLGIDGATGTGDPTEIAILAAAFEQGIRKDKIEAENPRVSTEPFDPGLRRMSISRQDGKTYVKGAVESVLPLCRSVHMHTESLTAAVSGMSSRGLRILAVASGERSDKLNFLGLLGMADPPRPEAVHAIAEARAAGITPIMITGDHPGTAAAIAHELGLVLDGESLESRVHARATPEDKLNLVRHWKNQGAVVAMTGDGVNDAPALREAHIGIAMGKTGTEVTRQAADLVLADDNFATIIAAVREGRCIFENIRKAITYLLAGNFAEVSLVIGAIAVGLPLPLLASHLLWINLVTDALPALTLIVEPSSPNVMKRAPRDLAERLLGRAEWTQVLCIGLLEASLAVFLFAYILREQGEAHARNIVFTTIIFSQVLRVFSARSATRTFWRVGPLSNPWLLGISALTLTLQVSLHYLPLSQRLFGLSALSARDFLWILPVSLVPLTLIELKKLTAGRIVAKSPIVW